MRRLFILGLTAIVPVVITIYVIVGLFKFTDGILGKFINRYLEKYLGYSFPGLGILLAFLLIIFLGLLIHISRMRLLRAIESLFLKIPLINKIYFPIKKIMEFLFFNPSQRFRRAVLVEYPRKGIYSIGFITNETDKSLKKSDKLYYNVFIPSSPSPLTGFMIVVPEDDVISLQISVEEAISMIVSGGVLNPQDLKK